MPALDSKITTLMERASAAAKKKKHDPIAPAPLSANEIDALSARMKKLHPFPVPPSFRAFLGQVGAVGVGGYDKDGDFDETGFRVLPPKEIFSDTRELVHVPKGVEWEDAKGKPCTISTNHLVAFGEIGGDGEGRWCFATTEPQKSGELGVYYHHQDEPRCAKNAKTGEWIDRRASRPEFDGFIAWLEACVKRYEGRK
jgi:hypothetical protein